MKDFRFTGAVTLLIAVAAVAAFILADLVGQSQEPPAPSHQTSTHRETSPTAPKTSFIAPKTLARRLAPTALNYYRVHVALDSTLRAGKHTFHLYAADVPGREDTCNYRDGRRWACGLRAYVALLNLIGSAAIECHPRDATEPNVVICHKDDVDLSEWMLEHGWARLHAGVTDKRYVAAAETAKAAGIGIWAENPPRQHDTSSR